MSCQGRWAIDSQVQLYHNLQKILWFRLVWDKIVRCNARGTPSVFLC